MFLGYIFSFYQKQKKKILQTFFHVPTFMLISFYFSYNLFNKQNIIKIKSRLERLVIPFLIMPIIQISLNILFNLKLNTLSIVFWYKSIDSNIKKPNIYIKKIIIDLILQYITGYKILISLWFLQILILFTIAFEIIFYFFKIYSLIILRLLAIISFWLQYSEYNYIIFFNYKPYIRSVSHIVEMIPIAVTGINLSSIQLLRLLKINYKKSICYSIILLYFIYKYNVFGYFNGFSYSGIKQNIAAICIFISFSLIPFEKIKNTIYFNIIRQVSRYTGGIYYFHQIIIYSIKNLTHSNNDSMFKCIIIYIVGYLICFIGSKVFRRNKLKYIFN